MPRPQTIPSTLLAGTSQHLPDPGRWASQSLAFQWEDTTDWSLAGIQLQAGANALMLEAIDHEGNIIQQLTFNITKTTNAPPVIVIETSPQSKNVSLGEALMLDASGSYDPEGSALASPGASPPSRRRQSRPGGCDCHGDLHPTRSLHFHRYRHDDQPQESARAIDIAVYGPEGFSTFGNETLEGFWEYFNIDKHGNSPDSPYFSLQDNEGRLTINIPLGMRPLGLPSPNCPPRQSYVDFGDNWRYDESGTDRPAKISPSPDSMIALAIQPRRSSVSVSIDQPPSFPDPPG